MNGDCHTAWLTSLSCVSPFDSATWPGQHRFQQFFLWLAAWRACGSSVQSKLIRHWRREKHCRAQLERFGQLPGAGVVYCRNEVSLKEGRLAMSCMVGMNEELTTTLPKEICILFLLFTAFLRISLSTSGARSNRMTCIGGPVVFKRLSAAFDPEDPTKVTPLSGIVRMPISTDFDTDSTFEVRIDDCQQYVGDEGL